MEKIIKKWGNVLLCDATLLWPTWAVQATFPGTSREHRFSAVRIGIIANVRQKKKIKFHDNNSSEFPSHCVHRVKDAGQWDPCSAWNYSSAIRSTVLWDRPYCYTVHHSPCLLSLMRRCKCMGHCGKIKQKLRDYFKMLLFKKYRYSKPVHNTH